MLHAFAAGNRIFSLWGLTMKSIEYLNKVKAKLHITSDYGLAKALGISKQAVARYYKTGGGFDDDIARTVAKILDLHPGLVMLDMHKERAQTPESRGLWEEIYKGFLLLLPHAKRGGFAL